MARFHSAAPAGRGASMTTGAAAAGHVRAGSERNLTLAPQRTFHPAKSAGDPTLRTRLLNVGGVRTRVLQQGSGDRVVLFIHGLGGWAEHWRGAMSAAARAGFMTYAPDLPGFG